MPDPIELELLRRAYQGPVELSDACARVRQAGAAPNPYDARDKVRLSLDTWLERGWVELYTSGSGSLRPVPVDERRPVLDLETNWERPEPGETSVWFATTEPSPAAARSR